MHIKIHHKKDYNDYTEYKVTEGKEGWFCTLGVWVGANASDLGCNETSLDYLERPRIRLNAS
jgi:hypothetical protein